MGLVGCCDERPHIGSTETSGSISVLQTARSTSCVDDGESSRKTLMLRYV